MRAAVVSSTWSHTDSGNHSWALLRAIDQQADKTGIERLPGYGECTLERY